MHIFLKKLILVVFRERVRVSIVKARKFSLCADMWSPKASESGYMGVTAHYFDKEKGKLESVLLAVEFFPQKHTAANIRGVMDKILNDWGFSANSVLRYVTDNAVNIRVGLDGDALLIQSKPDDPEEEDGDDFISSDVSFSMYSNALCITPRT